VKSISGAFNLPRQQRERVSNGKLQIEAHFILRLFVHGARRKWALISQAQPRLLPSTIPRFCNANTISFQFIRGGSLSSRPPFLWATFSISISCTILHHSFGIMLSTPLTAVLALATLSSASVLPNAKRDATILKLPVITVNQTCPLSKRQDAVSLANIQTGTRYLISCERSHDQPGDL
jgi:hypothetical protein